MFLLSYLALHFSKCGVAYAVHHYAIVTLRGKYYLYVKVSCCLHLVEFLNKLVICVTTDVSFMLYSVIQTIVIGVEFYFTTFLYMIQR